MNGKSTTVLLLLLMILFAASLPAQTTVTIGSGTSTNQYIPLRCRGYYSYTQQIYTQAQINYSGSIEKLRFYKASSTTPSYSGSWTVYLGLTAKGGFASTSDWVPLSGLTQVFSGTVSLSGTGWREITLATPFTYNNSGNLVVAVDENTSGRASSEIYWRVFTSSANTGLF